MNLRLTITAAAAVILASLSLSSVIHGANWFVIGMGAVAVVTAAGILSRQNRLASAMTATVAVLIAVVPLLSTSSWPERMAGLVIVVVTALSATGARPLRGFAVLACYLAFLLLYLNIVFAHGSSFGQIIPSHSSLSALGRLWRGSFADFDYMPPVTDLEPVSLVAAAGIGAVAIAVDILAVRLRRPAVSGLPLLLLFSVPVASNLKVFGVQQMIIFALSLTGYLGLLAADGRDRLRMWGRLVTFRHVQSPDETGSGPDTRELAASGRRIGLAAVCIAIVVPVILPAMHAHDLFATTPTGGGGSGSSGVSPLLQVGPLLEGKPQPVLTYETTAAQPREQYFQVYALNYDARVNKWLPPAGVDHPVIGGALPWKAPGIVSSSPVLDVRTTVNISRDYNGAPVLPLPYVPIQVNVVGATDGWVERSGSQMVFNNGLTMAHLSYTVLSTDPDPRAANIPNLAVPPGIKAEYGTYSGPDRAQLRAIAKRITAGATSPLASAKDLEDWFLNNFSYSLRPDLPSTNWLPAFLTTDQRGYCSQFAWAFAVLARLVGIPSRIAVGYTAGTPVPNSGGTWQVTTHDAHAWPELYFSGEGWLRFEPTPTGAAGQATAVIPPYAAVGSNSLAPHNGNQPATQPGHGTSPNGGKRGQNLGKLGRLSSPGGTAARKSSGSDLWLAIVIPAAVFLLIAWPALIRLATRRRRWLTASGDADLAHAAWRELTDDLADYGLGFTPAETPRAVARRVASDGGLDESGIGAVKQISAAEERARYARLAGPGAALKASVRTAHRAISASVPRRQRLRARLLPASTLLAARQLAQRAGEMLSWLDFSWPAVRRQLRAVVHRPG
ncbi:MAG TPA: transglutaminaseTgpA domain-containing protein [Streptosporangiaceae bacterium]|nr:transglutaminaseTgpA domain-containing protein [Streptosporangiaceae bacterium]